MPPAPSLTSDAMRPARPYGFARSDALPDAELDSLVQAAAVVCGVPIALLSLFDEERHWSRDARDLAGILQAVRHMTQEAPATAAGEVLEIPDISADPRCAELAASRGGVPVRFFACVTVRIADVAVGALCVIDNHRKHLTASQRDILGSLAASASSAVAGWRARQARRQASIDLQISEERERHLYEATPAILQSNDADGRLLTVSDAWLATFGYSREEVIGRRSTDFLTDGSRGYAQSVVMPKFLATGRVENAEFRMVAKGGQIVDTLLSAVLERDAGGSPVRSLAVLEDVTARRQAERALAEERQRLANLIEATGAATWEWNVRTGAVRFNERWACMVGRTLDELEPLTTQTWSDLSHPHDRTRWREALERHFDGRARMFECEARMRHRAGHYLWVLVRGSVMTWNAAGQPEWMLGTQQDITERKRQEDALRKSEDFLDRASRAAGVGAWEVDLLTREVHWSAETCRLHGMKPGHRPTLDEAIGFYAPQARPVIRAAIEEAAASGKGFDLELPFERADGARLWVRAVGSAAIADGRAVRVTGAFQNVTARVAERQALQQANERLTLATESGGIGIWDWDVARDRMIWDHGMYRLYGMEPGDDAAAFELWQRRLHPDDRAVAEQAIHDALAGTKPFDTEFRVVWPDGSVHTLHGSGRVTRDAQGRAVRMVGANWDVTEPRRLAARLSENHEMLRVTLQSIGDGVITTDAQGFVVWLNPVAERMTGWTTADASGEPVTRVLRIVNEETREPAENPVMVCLAEGRVVGMAQQTTLVSRTGDEYGIEDTASPIRAEQGDTLGAVLVFHDVTEQRRLSGEMSHRATHDMLTGLVNRAEFEQRLRRLLHRAQSDGSLNALLFLDLDQFKLVNDACGHAVGDQLLMQVSKLLSDIVRTSDTLARLGGDEFAILLDHCSTVPAQRLAQRICDRMEDFRFIHENRRFRIGASIGLVPVDNRWTTTAAVMQAADTSCYAAKEAGRNRVHVWFDTDQTMRARHGEMQWATRLEQALDEDGFVLFAQRIHAVCGDDAAGGDGAWRDGAGGVAARGVGAGPARGVHAEVLLRLVKSDGSSVLPGAFLPAAERFHLASRIDRWVLRNVMLWMKSVPSLDLIENLSVNLSGQSVGDRAFHRWALDMLAEAGAEICGKLCLEITETAAVTNLADAAIFIEQVRAIGVRVALDDFGAGASSFGYLKNMPVDFLKIDGQFIRDLVSDPLDEVAVRCFVDVAKVVHIKTVAEFVDQPAVMQRLHGIGIDFAQGYLVHRPAPIMELLEAYA
jgi:diguanylate cyclase (GGDEF)-like protein/PAS domain S-box-containing protein